MEEGILQTKEDVKRVVTKEEPDRNITPDDLFRAMEQAQDAKDLALSNMVDSLFSPDKIYMIARLDKNLAYYMVKHIIIKQFFFMYYTNCKSKLEFIKDDEFPYYKIIETQKVPDKLILEKSYDIFLNKLLEITISFEGKGREEIISIIKALREDIQEEEMAKGGLLKKLY